MSAEINNGGPAFPVSCSHDGIPLRVSYPNVDGMSLRDWFAGHATESDIEAHTGGDIHPKTGRTYNQRTREQAKYSYADAMIAARKVKP